MQIRVKMTQVLSAKVINRALFDLVFALNVLFFCYGERCCCLLQVDVWNHFNKKVVEWTDKIYIAIECSPIKYSTNSNSENKLLTLTKDAMTEWPELELSPLSSVWNFLEPLTLMYCKVKMESQTQSVKK